MNNLSWYYDTDCNDILYVAIIDDNYCIYYYETLSKQEMKVFLKIINEYKYALLYFKDETFKQLCDIKLTFFKNKRIPLKINYTLAELERLLEDE